MLIGIGVALLIKGHSQLPWASGLDLRGALSINLIAALALIAWLIFGDLQLPLRGAIILWSLVVVLVVLSVLEWAANKRGPKASAD